MYFYTTDLNKPEKTTMQHVLETDEHLIVGFVFANK